MLNSDQISFIIMLCIVFNTLVSDIILNIDYVLIREGLQDMDLDVGRWLRKNAPGIKTLVVINKAEKLDAFSGSLAASVGEAYSLGFGDPVALSAETGSGMSELHEALKPLLEDYMLQVLTGKTSVACIV
mgnify:FL=1